MPTAFLLNRLKKPLGIGIAVLIVASILTVRQISSIYKIYFIEESNQTPVSSTITWVSSKKVVGCVYVLRFPLKRVCDDHGENRGNHLVTLKNLNPKATYPLLIKSGFAFATHTIEPKFIPEAAPGLPNIAYGKVVMPDGQTPLVNSTILIHTPAGIVSTLTNQSGGWSADLKGDYPPGTLLPLTITWNYVHLNQKYRLVIGRHQPTETIMPSELIGIEPDDL